MTEGLEALGRIVLGFVPVGALLLALLPLDGYKLVRLRAVLATVAIGAALALPALWANDAIRDLFSVRRILIIRYVAPVVEEGLKAAILVWLLRRHRIGFLVDAGIHGFAVGTGFALAENLFYWVTRPEAGFVVWLVRGCGTAIMHAGAGALLAIVTKTRADRSGVVGVREWGPAFLVAAGLHALYNHFVLSPVLSAVGVALLAPPIVVLAFEWASRQAQRWLRVGFDADTELLEAIVSGRTSDSPVGTYLRSLRDRFEGEVVADLLCYLRIRLELSLRAKGILMLREAGFEAEALPDEGIRESLRELEFLETSIGTTGRLALSPFLRDDATSFWERSLLKDPRSRTSPRHARGSDAG